MEILKFGWLISGRIFPVLLARGDVKNLACVEQKLKFLTIHEVKKCYEQFSTFALVNHTSV